MSSDSEIKQLRQELAGLRDRLEVQEHESRYMRDRLAIQDVIHRHSRGVDRHDAELLTSCYHPDALARYGPRTIPGPEIGTWSNESHTGRFKLHLHSITTQNCEILGDTAYCESYVVTAFLAPDQKRSSIVVGRYFDQLERRDGEWKIKIRRTVIDICTEGDASFNGVFRGEEVPESVFWTKDDPSYRRPLDVETPVPSWH